MNATCQNCGGPVGTGYCPLCGQTVRRGTPTIRESLRDALGDLFEFDSRLWRSLLPLVLRPGELTTEYLAGRRARYIPPFRMYLVLSLFFFVLPQGPDRDHWVAPEEAESAKAESHCETARDTIHLPWLDAEASREWVQTTCERISADSGREFIREFVERVPLLMLLLVPILAAVMRLLYLRSTHHYMVHLLFLVHAHSFAFLLFGLGKVFVAIVGLLTPTTLPADLVDGALPIWALLYFFLAMRRVYGEGRTRTALKYVAVFTASVLSLGLLVLLGVTYTALTL